MRIAFGSDHAGFEMKQRLATRLLELGHEVQDLGTVSPEPADYPDFGRLVARAVAAGQAEIGILICGTGIGMSMAANRVAGARAARCCSDYDARFARLHNDANILCLGARVTGPGLADAIVDSFLATPFEGGRHARRVAKIDENA